MLAVVAVVVSASVALRSDELTGEHTVSFTEGSAPLAGQGPVDAASPGATFSWQAPANATAARFYINVTFDGMAVRGGSATISARIIGPDGTVFPATAYTMAIAQGGSSATASIQLAAQWALMPEPVRDDRAGNATLTWTDPVKIVVSVEAPADLPVARYAFAADVSGIATTFFAK